MVPAPQLDPQSEMPLYQQLHRHFAELIRSHILKRGERLPPTRELAGLLGLNRTTVSAAYEMLEAQGLIAGQVGRGSFVTGGPAAKAGVDWPAILPHGNSTASFSREEISFVMSRPSRDLFPLDDFRASCSAVMARQDLADILQLGSPSGYEPLRKRLLKEACLLSQAAPTD